MIGKIREHHLRQVQSLDGIWDFAFVGEVSADEIELGEIDFNDRLSVPGCFDATPKYAGKRGLVAYRRIIRLETGGRYRLKFEAVNHWCRVFVNGKLQREKSGGFTRFLVDFTGRPGENEIVLLVDNRLDNFCSPLHLAYYDWYHYGGICRPVRLDFLGDRWIDNVQVLTLQLDPPVVQVRVIYGNDLPESAKLRIEVGDEILVDEAVSLESPGGVLDREIVLEGRDLWSPAAPILHILNIQLGEDDLRTHFGIRQVAVDGEEVHINGKPLRLLGFNRHETHPQFGHALPESLLLNDIQQLLDMGCNFVRGSHYPQDPRFLDLCDQAGICVWVEATGWQQTAQHLNDPTYLDAQLQNVDEMVASAFNHPSVIMWGALNEGRSDDPDCVAGYTAVLDRIRELDTSRPVTFATNRIPAGDKCLHLADLIAINTYPGWYLGDIEDIPENLDGIIALADAVTEEKKPIIVSEIGAGAIPGWRDQHGTRWTEAYQARILEIIIEHLFINRDRVMGLAIWQFCDIRSSEAVHRILGRPRGFNNKGVVDEYRRPKLGYDVVKRLYRTLTVSGK